MHCTDYAKKKKNPERNKNKKSTSLQNCVLAGKKKKKGHTVKCLENGVNRESTEIYGEKTQVLDKTPSRVVLY